MTSDDRLTWGFILDVLDVRNATATTGSDNQHTGQAVGAIRDLAYVYDGTRNASCPTTLRRARHPRTRHQPTRPARPDAVILTGAEVRHCWPRST